MHILQRTDALAELDELWRQWRAGVLTNDEYKIAFAQVDAAHSHDQLCDNGDKRRADRIVGGRLLCSVCALKAHEARA